MTIHKSILASAITAVIALGSSGNLRAADNPIVTPPAPQYITPAGPQSIAPAGGCPTCAAPASTTAMSTSGCKTCGSSWFHHHTKGPFEVNLCPGACFGYFQTQWRKWDEVCPYPYQGIGVSDAPKPPTPLLPIPGTTLPNPRPADTKPSDTKPTDPKSSDAKPPMSSSTTLPQIPIPRNGF